MRAFFYIQDSGTRGSALSEKLSAKYWQNGGGKNIQACAKPALEILLSFLGSHKALYFLYFLYFIKR